MQAGSNGHVDIFVYLKQGEARGYVTKNNSTSTWQSYFFGVNIKVA